MSQLDDLQARIDARRAELGIRPRQLSDLVPQVLGEEGSALEVVLRLKAEAEKLDFAQCEICGESFVADGSKICERKECQRIARAQEFAARPKADMLARFGVPEEYRQDFDLEHHGGQWPAPVRGEAGTVPEWCGSPHFVTVLGRTGAGKSWLAAELMWRCVANAGGKITSGFWVLGEDLAAEDRQAPLGYVPPNMARARSCGVLVVDDFGWGVAERWLARLCEHRHAHHRPTIWTTHRPFNRGKDPVRMAAPMIFDRLRFGWVIPLERGSGR